MWYYSGAEWMGNRRHMRAKKQKHELAWVKDENQDGSRFRYEGGRRGASKLIVFINRYPRRQMRAKEAGPLFMLAGLLTAMAAKWLGIW